MKVATVADLRNRFASVSQWLQDGQKVEIRKRGKVFATLAPPRRKKGKGWPDLGDRLEKLFPKVSRGKTGSEIVAEGRGEW